MADLPEDLSVLNNVILAVARVLIEVSFKGEQDEFITGA
jgi:hypothetical protein